MKTKKPKIRNKRTLTIADVLFYVPSYLFYILFTLLCIFPFYYMFINSISANDLSARGLIIFLPRDIHFTNYLEVFRLRGIGQAALVSVARTVIGTFGAVLCTSFVAYLLSKKILWGQKFWYRYFIVTMYLNVGLIPWFLNMQMLGLTNSFLAYVIGVVNPFNLVLVKTFIDAIPPSLEESAEIDGAGPLKIFFRLILPLSKPILATIAVFTAVLQWNSFIDNLILITDSRLNTLQFVLWEFFNSAASVALILQGGPGGRVDPATIMTGTSLRMTISMVVVLPILLVYPFFQRYFVKGIMLGAVKG
ncbi:MAG: carbohydrate ABC transporter permease [Defluviitaleaceae bacterium]|nr:carbohydrate ABC transporter permease [Defluviitaleaceae bacterium]